MFSFYKSVNLQSGKISDLLHLIRVGLFSGNTAILGQIHTWAYDSTVLRFRWANMIREIHFSYLKLTFLTRNSVS